MACCVASRIGRLYVRRQPGCNSYSHSRSKLKVRPPECKILIGCLPNHSQTPGRRPTFIQNNDTADGGEARVSASHCSELAKHRNTLPTTCPHPHLHHHSYELAPIPPSGCVGSIHFTVVGSSTGTTSGKLTATASESLLIKTHSNFSSALALIS